MNLQTVAESLVTVNTENKTMDTQRLADMMHMPISHYLGPIGYQMSKQFGFSHPAITLGMLVAQAVREAAAYEQNELGESFEDVTSFQIVGCLTDWQTHHEN